MKNNTLTIIRKEFARFFGDRQLLFTAVIMPGLLIYIIYSLMGDAIGKMVTEGQDEVVVMQVCNMPPSLATVLGAMDSSTVIVEQAFDSSDIVQLEDKDVNVVLVDFPQGFDSLVAAYNPQLGLPAPNVSIYYNSTNNAAMRVYAMLTATLTAYEDGMSNRFDVNRADSDNVVYNQATDESIGAMVWSKILPMLIMMLLFSGVMAIAPTSIAGEKERGTIATLLVTPMRRNQLAYGKVVSLSAIALLSGISSFVGIALALPKIMQDQGALNFSYGWVDYAGLLLLIFSSVIIMASAVSILSALAKDVKNSGTMVTPLMLVVMLLGLVPLFQDGASQTLAIYLIPFYNSIEVMTALFLHELQWLPLLVTVGANIVYTVIAIWGLTRLFNSEKVMFSR